jgi:hypothetical protein
VTIHGLLGEKRLVTNAIVQGVFCYGKPKTQDEQYLNAGEPLASIFMAFGRAWICDPIDRKSTLSPF